MHSHAKDIIQRREEQGDGKEHDEYIDAREQVRGPESEYERSSTQFRQAILQLIWTLALFANEIFGPHQYFHVGGS